MALTDGEVATKVLKRLGLPIAQRPNIFLFITPARVQIARAVAVAPDDSRKIFQKIFNGLTITSQACDLSTEINRDPKTEEPMILTHPFPAVRVGSADAWFKSDYQLMSLGTIQNDQIWCALQGNILHFRKRTGTVTGTADITAQYVPSIGNWPAGRFEVELIDAVASLAGAGARQ